MTPPPLPPCREDDFWLVPSSPGGKLTEGWTDFARKGGKLISIMGIGVDHPGEVAPDGVSAIIIL